MSTSNYVVRSLELHLFFGRIMKEHALFLRAGFTPADPSFSRKAEYFKQEFEKLLSRAITLGRGRVSRPVLTSGELVTEFTAQAERQTEQFTGIPISKGLTARTLQLGCGCPGESCSEAHVRRLNQRAMELLDGLIAFKRSVLEQVLHCGMFTMNYPLLIEHILREAELYREHLCVLEKEGDLPDRVMGETECFWNRIMMEHALFIRGLLDPTETELVRASDQFASEYGELLQCCDGPRQQSLLKQSLEQTLRFRDFKQAGTQGIGQCRIRSVILPLLADHVLREANHYLRLLSACAQ